MTDPVPPVPPPEPAITSGREFLLVIFRTFGGFGILFACLILLLRRPAWQLSAIDVVYWGTAAILVLLHTRAARAAGAIQEWPATRNWSIAIGLLLWLGAQSVQAIP